MPRRNFCDRTLCRKSTYCASLEPHSPSCTGYDPIDPCTTFCRKTVAQARGSRNTSRTGFGNQDIPPFFNLSTSKILILSTLYRCISVYPYSLKLLNRRYKDNEVNFRNALKIVDFQRISVFISFVVFCSNSKGIRDFCKNGETSLLGTT